MTKLSSNARLVLAAFQKSKLEKRSTEPFEVIILAGLDQYVGREAVRELVEAGLIQIEGDLG